MGTEVEQQVQEELSLLEVQPTVAVHCQPEEFVGDLAKLQQKTPEARYSSSYRNHS